MKKDALERRDFIRMTTLFAVSISIPVVLSCKGDGGALPPAEAGCKTTDDILGPYYKAGAPFREDIVPEGSGGTPLLIAGKVFSRCDQPLPGATVEIWNANAEGGYDTSDQYLFRGQFLTGEEGAYRFRTIIPGKYLNGGTYRPSHLHFRITAPGHRELVSQVYFKDDPYIAADPWAGDPRAKERILPLQPDANGMDSVTFDIYLSEA
jgi:protocatechuate 3,4-dioxygenase beta subunit